MSELDSLSELLDVLKTVNADDLKDALKLVTELKQRDLSKKEDIKVPEIKEEPKVYLNKEYVYEGRQDCYIYQDNRTKAKNYYINIWDSKTQRRYKQSLKTTKREIAISEAMNIYAEMKGRIKEGRKLNSITSKDLVREYQNLRRKDISEATHVGLTLRSFNALCDRIRYWEWYMEELGYTNTRLENIPREIGIGFGNWIKAREKKAAIGTPRKNRTINAIIGAVKKMYYDVGKEQNYVKEDEIPRFKYLKVPRETEFAKDVLTADEYTAVTNYMKYKWVHEKGITRNAYLKRRIYALTFTIHYYTGCRNKELLGIKWSDISMPRHNNKDDVQKVNRRILIPAENSKTGRSRIIIAPIGKQLERLKKWYTEFGYYVKEDSNDYVFLKTTKLSIGTNTPQTQKSMSDNLDMVLAGADKEGYIVLGERKISNYSARHHYITEALLRGVDIYDISLNCGVDIGYIQSTYSHVTSDMRGQDITKNLGAHKLVISDEVREFNRSQERTIGN